MMDDNDELELGRAEATGDRSRSDRLRTGGRAVDPRSRGCSASLLDRFDPVARVGPLTHRPHRSSRPACVASNPESACAHRRALDGNGTSLENLYDGQRRCPWTMVPSDDTATHATEELEPHLVTVLSKKFEMVTRDMTQTLLKSARSGVINSARDFSSAVTLADGRQFAIDEGLPANLGNVHFTPQYTLSVFDDISPGDCFLPRPRVAWRSLSRRTARPVVRRDGLDGGESPSTRLQDHGTVEVPGERCTPGVVSNWEHVSSTYGRTRGPRGRRSPQ